MSEADRGGGRTSSRAGAARYLITFRWANTLSQVAGYLSAVALLAATLIMLQSVITRYFLGTPTVWQTEVSIYLLIFVTFVGAAYGLRHHAHVGVDLVVERLPQRPQLVLRVVTAVLALGVVLVVLWTSGQLWWEAYSEGDRSPTALRAPLGVVYAILPLGMLLVALQYVAFIIEGLLALFGKGEGPLRADLLQQRSPELAAVDEEEQGAPPASPQWTQEAKR